MTYWNEINDSHIKFWNSDKYPSYYKIKNSINKQGYRSDVLKPSEVVYLGTCDVMASIDQGDLRWTSVLHRNRHFDQPYIALGTVASGLPAMIRRLYSYIQNFGSPKYVYMTVPRIDSYEFVNKSGNCYNLSSRTGSARFALKAGLVDEQEFDIWVAQLEANKRLNNPENIKYILEERFAFIETICKAYDIKLKWTFNPSDASIVVLYRNLSAFKDISDFMKESFVGLPEAKDTLGDRTIGIETHFEIYEKFVGDDKWDYDRLSQQAEINYNWLKNQFGDELIRIEV